MKNSKLSQEAAKTIAKAKRIEEKKKTMAAKASQDLEVAFRFFTLLLCPGF